MPPLGIAYIASVLKMNKYNVDLIDMEVCQWGPEDLSKHLLKVKQRKHYDIVGISALTPTINNVKLYAKVIKQVFPDSLIVIGGPHPTLEPEDTFKNVPEAYAVFRGESEYSFLKFVNAINSGVTNPNPHIPGLCLRNGVNSPEIPHIQDLDDLPFPAYDLLPMKYYSDAITPTQECSMMLASRGCSYNCVFCEEPLIYGKKFRTRSPENVVDEIELLVKKYGMKHIIFHDSTFNLDMERVEAICDEIIRRKIKFSWRVKARVDYVNRRMLRKMKLAGCRLILYGAENGNQKILNLMRKGITIEQVKRAVQLTKEEGIPVLLFFIVGFPGETRNDIERTIKYSIELDPDYAEFCIATPLPKSELRELVKDNIVCDDWSKYYQWSPVISYNGLSKEELLSLYHKAYINFYLRPSYILKKVKTLRSRSNLKMYVKGMFSIILFSGTSKLFARVRGIIKSE